MTERRQRRDRRQLLPDSRLNHGRRAEDDPSLAMKGKGQHYIDRAQKLGLLEQAGVMIWALARIEELETELDAIRSAHQKGGLAFKAKKTPAQHREWAVEASKRRWCGRARIVTPWLFTDQDS